MCITRHSMLYELIMLIEFVYVTLRTVFSTGDEFVSRLSEMLSCLEILGNESQVVTLSFLPHSFEEVSSNKKTKHTNKRGLILHLTLMTKIHMSTS